MNLWIAVAAQIATATGKPFNVERVQSVSGGSINAAHRITGGDRPYFVKVNQATRLGMFEAEALALRQLAATHTLRVPTPVTWGVAHGQAFLVLEWLELRSRGDWAALGRQLAALHRQRGDRFGWDQTNTIGSTLQVNTWHDDWVTFWAECRLGHQLALARRKGFQSDREEELWEVLPAFFRTYRPFPSLLHGDLWGGNVGFLPDGTPVMFDPATYWGDREADLAMTELFGGFDPEFYRAYQAEFPLDGGYPQRKVLYNLYHILNHFNLFGGGYGDQAHRAIDQLCRMAANFAR